MIYIKDTYQIPAYVISNENQRWATSAIPNAKSVLTVTGSGDQALFYKLSGATIVDTFDVSHNAGLIQDIKFCAIKHIKHPSKYVDLLNALHIGDNIYTIPQMHKLIPYLTDTSRKTIIHNKGLCMFSVGCSVQYYPENIPTHYEYKKLKTILSEPFNFIQSDLESLSGKIYGQYDLINLSNIFDYCYSAATQAKILSDLSEHLNIGGHIVYLPQLPRFKYNGVQIRNKNIELRYKDTIKKDISNSMILFQRTR